VQACQGRLGKCRVRRVESGPRRIGLTRRFTIVTWHFRARHPGMVPHRMVGVACTNDGRARWARVWAVDQALGASTALTASVWAVVLQGVTGVQESALASNLACTPKWEVKQRQRSRRSFRATVTAWAAWVAVLQTVTEAALMVGQTAGQVRSQRQGRGCSKGHR
jgi:hypothetical protein